MNIILHQSCCLSDITKGFNFSRAKFKYKDVVEITGRREMNTLLDRVITQAMVMILKDIITNDVKFHLPTTGNTYAWISVEEMPPDRLKKYLKNGGRPKIDLLKTNFKFYIIVYRSFKRNRREHKRVYLTHKFLQPMYDNMNAGKVYCGLNDKYLKDYLQPVNDLFPTLCKTDVRLILMHYFRTMFSFVNKGIDMSITNPHIWMYIGTFKGSAFSFYEYMRPKLIKRLRYKAGLTDYDNKEYYYVLMDEMHYQDYLNAKGRSDILTTRIRMKAYKLLDEALVKAELRQHLFRYYCPEKETYTFTSKEWKVNNFVYLDEVKQQSFVEMTERNMLKNFEIYEKGSTKHISRGAKYGRSATHSIE